VEVEGRANVRSGLSAFADKREAGEREAAAGSAPVIGQAVAVDKRAAMQIG
jgi:hypothetical protein